MPKDPNLQILIELKEGQARIEQKIENMKPALALGVEAHQRVGAVETTLSTLKSVFVAIPVIGLIVSGFLWLASAHQGIQASEMVRK